MLRLLGLGDLDGSGAEDPAAKDTLTSPRQQMASPLPSSQVCNGNHLHSAAPTEP